MWHKREPIYLLTEAIEASRAQDWQHVSDRIVLRERIGRERRTLLLGCLAAGTLAALAFAAAVALFLR